LFVAAIMGRFGFPIKTFASAVTATGLASAFFTTANDEWPEVTYGVRKSLGLLPTPPPLKKRTKVCVLGSGWGAVSLIQRLDPDDVELTGQFFSLA
jgi:hypothetical protein